MRSRSRPRSLPPSSAPGEFAAEVDRFLNYVGLEKGLSPNTQASYQSDLDHAAIFLHAKGVRSWASVSAEEVMEWQQALADQGMAASSQARKRTAVRMLARFLVQEEIRSDDLSERLESPKLGRRIPETMTVDEIKRLLEQATTQDPRGWRDRAILELFYSSGLRVTELVELTLSQLHLQEGFLRVIGKGSKERIVPVGAQAIEVLQNYLTAGRPALVRPSRTRMEVFLGEHGGGLTRQRVWRVVREAAKRAGITKPVKPHLIRHTFATHLLEGGADLRAIQEMLGHASVTTTQIYTAVESQRLLDEHERFHPRQKQT